MLLSAVSVLVVAQSSSEVPEELMNNPVLSTLKIQGEGWDLKNIFNKTKMSHEISLEILGKNNDRCILILVIYCRKTGLLHTKISNHNIIYSS